MVWWVPLVVALAAAATKTGVDAAQGKYSDGSAGAGANDAFGDFFKNTIMGWALGTVGGVAGEAVSGASSAGADQGMWAGMSDAEIEAAMGAAQGGQGAAMAGAEAAATAPELAAAQQAGGIADVGAMNPNDMSQYGVDIQAGQVMAEPQPTWVDNLFSGDADVSPMKWLFKKLGSEQEYTDFSKNNIFSDTGDFDKKLFSSPSDEDEQRKQMEKAFLEMQAYGLTGLTQQAKERGNQGMKQAEQYEDWWSDWEEQANKENFGGLFGGFGV